MNATEVWTIYAIGFCLGLIGREVFSGWAGLIRTAIAQFRPPVAPEPEPEPVTPDITADEFRTVHGWAQLNPWYAADTTLNMEAQIIHMSLRSREPHLTLERNLAEVTAEMHRRHPEIVPTRQ